MENSNSMTGRLHTRKEELTGYYNATLHTLMSHEINVNVLEKTEPRGIFGERQYGHSPDGRPLVQKITNEEQLKAEKLALERQTKLLETIQAMLGEETTS